MKTLVLAYHNIGCAGIRALLAQGFDIQAVFTHIDDPKENIWFESVAELAAAFQQGTACHSQKAPGETPLGARH